MSDSDVTPGPPQQPASPYQQAPYPQGPNQGQYQPPPQYQQQYPVAYQPVYAPVFAPPAPPRGLSISSFVIGLVNLFFWFSLILPILGFILGFIGLRKEPHGRGFAIAGIIINGFLLLGAVALIAIILLSIFGVIGVLPLFFLTDGNAVPA